MIPRLLEEYQKSHKQRFNISDYAAPKISTVRMGIIGTGNRGSHHAGTISKMVFLHSECSHTMISCEDYEQFLMPIDAKWSKEKEYFGIHYCGNDPHRYAESFAKLPKLDFLDLGWGGDVAHLRKHLPNTFFNIRLSPVELVNMTMEEIRATITKLVSESANPALTGVCCINMDEKVSDDKIDAIFETMNHLDLK